MSLIKSYRELYECVGGSIEGSLQWDSIKPHVNGAENKLAVYSGFAMLNEFRKGKNTDNEVFIYCKNVVAWFLLLRVSQLTDIALTEHGHVQVQTDTHKPAFFGQKLEFRREIEIEAYRQVEALLIFLSTNRDDYPIWVQSEAFTRHTETMIRYAFQWQQHIGLDCERVTFERLRGLIRDCEQAIRKNLPKKFYKHLSQINETDAMTDMEAQAIQLCQTIIMHVVESEAVKRNIATNTGTAFLVTEFVIARGETTQKPASLPALTTKIRYEAIVQSERTQDLVALLIENIKEYPMCFQTLAGGNNDDTDAWNEKGEAKPMTDPTLPVIDPCENCNQCNCQCNNSISYYPNTFDFERRRRYPTHLKIKTKHF
jgi:hypothetical protein